MNDIKERLADMSVLSQSRTPADALKYIEEFEAENNRLRSMIADVIESTGDDPEIMAASRAEWAARALEAEAKLAKAVVELEEMLMIQNSEAAYGILRVYTKTLLAELKGDRDERRVHKQDVG
jgi:hypothetical protein